MARWKGWLVLEVEVKYRAADRDAVVARLVAWGAAADTERIEVDHYFNAPDRDLKQTDEAFRLRRIGSRSVLTYKGPKREAATKTRTEIEVPLADGDGPAADLERLLGCLGYRPVAVVRKSRRVYRFVRGGFDVEVCLDDVDRVGPFVELEVKADEDHFEQAKAVVLGVATDLELTDVERRSYLELLLAMTAPGSPRTTS